MSMQEILFGIFSPRTFIFLRFVVIICADPHRAGSHFFILFFHVIVILLISCSPFFSMMRVIYLLLLIVDIIKGV